MVNTSLSVITVSAVSEADVRSGRVTLLLRLAGDATWRLIDLVFGIAVTAEGIGAIPITQAQQMHPQELKLNLAREKAEFQKETLEFEIKERQSLVDRQRLVVTEVDRTIFKMCTRAFQYPFRLDSGLGTPKVKIGRIKVSIFSNIKMLHMNKCGIF